MSPSDNRVRKTASIPTNTKVESVMSITIDDLVKDYVNEIAFVWVDVQGCEYYALNGAKTLISSSKNLALQIEFWPLGLKETNSLSLLCQFCKEHFSRYIDIKEYINGDEVVHNINSIDSLSVKYKKTHTDLFLIR